MQLQLSERPFSLLAYRHHSSLSALVDVAWKKLFHFMYNFPFYDAQLEILMFELDRHGLQNLSLPILVDCDAHLRPDLIDIDIPRSDFSIQISVDETPSMSCSLSPFKTSILF